RHEPAKLDTQDRRERQAVPYPAGRADQALSSGVEGGGARAHAASGGLPPYLRADRRPRPHVFGRGEEGDQIGMLSETERAIFGRSYADEPDKLIAQLKGHEAITEATTLFLPVPNHLGVDYNAHVVEAILKHVAPGLGWR